MEEIFVNQFVCLSTGQDKVSFAYRVVNCWSSLSSDIVNAASLTAFEMKLRSVDMSSFCAEAIDVSVP